MTGMRWSNSQYFNPRHVGNLLAWLDAKDPSGNGTQPLNGTSIGTWKDKSANGFDFTQATGGNQPVYNSSVINSRPAITFNGTTSLITCSNTALAQSLVGEMTVFFVATYPNASSSCTNFSTNPIANPPRIVLHMPINPGVIFDYGDAGSGRLLNGNWMGTINTPYIVKAVASVINSTQYVSLNNVVTVSGTTPQPTSFGTSYGFTLGALSTLADFLNGSIGEFIIYNRYLNATEMANVYNYLKNRWGI